MAALDYGDAPGYATASNKKVIWQRLGEVNGIEDGVTWSTDNGLTWSNTEVLIIGQKVTLKFNFWQGNNGIHTFDQLLAVIDADQKDLRFEKLLIYQKIDTLPPRNETPNDLSASPATSISSLTGRSQRLSSPTPPPGCGPGLTAITLTQSPLTVISD